jgi:hypothetical protein
MATKKFLITALALVMLSSAAVWRPKNRILSMLNCVAFIDRRRGEGFGLNVDIF